MKKLIALLLCVMMVVSVFAGCDPAAPTPTDNKPADPTGSNDATLPDDITLTIGLPMNAMTEDYDTNAYTLWLEEVTGYDLQFQLYQTAVADYKSQLSVAMVDGDKLPDILLGFYLGEAVYEEYGEDGYFLDLAPYFNDKEGKAKTWWDKFNVYENEATRQKILNQMVADDGAIYCFPHLESTEMDAIRHQVYINTEWLKNVNMEMPTDPDSLYNVLKAFKDQDANGNGDPTDEIPLMAANTSNYGEVITYLINMFCYVSPDDNYFFRVDDSGKLYHDYTSDAYRKGLQFAHKLVSEGLMPASTLSLNNNNFKKNMSPIDGYQQIGVAVGHGSLIWPADAKIEQYAALPYWGYCGMRDQMNNWCCFITTDCEYPEAAWNVFMAMCTEEGGYRQRYGEKGVDWVDADPGTYSYAGKPAVIKVLNPDAYGGMNNSCWHHTMGSIIFNSENEVTQLDDTMSEFEQARMNMMAVCRTSAYEHMPPENVAGIVTYDTASTEAVKTQKSNSRSWVTSARTSFITGVGDQFNNPNDDAQWKAYCDGLEEQGMSDWLKVEQKLYTAQYGG